MCRCHRHDSNFKKSLKDCHGKRCTFFWIRSCTYLVEKQKIISVNTLQDFNQMCHMCRKSRETLLDALLIADICIDVLKNADFRICFYQKITARLCHQC